MNDITTLMSHDHRSCDESFARAETAISRGKWDEGTAELEKFIAELETHFTAEESILFPRFESVTGMTEGPTKVMRGEHADMREAVERMRDAVSRRDKDDYAGEAETLLILMQQHNMKEENVLYPMCDAQLAGENLPPTLAKQLGREQAA
ncbi:hemerythrin domain-containing protein [Aromatoleum buckelii]|uniref:Hemerythrin domain-containing protein n=1 Tax=Aromatoleum buckelii TaxID=200254 RepID=A0ABX1N015_9RHOO|nr:hemerythrin domain-containing protein [Aromatoleum buckelii]MCK0512924.1 hemerythrin domain-containing protein [Aromatoleum buckelii]